MDHMSHAGHDHSAHAAEATNLDGPIPHPMHGGWLGHMLPGWYCPNVSRLNCLISLMQLCKVLQAAWLVLDVLMCPNYQQGQCKFANCYIHTVATHCLENSLS